jgi:serine/threonine protein kinase
MFSKLLRKIQVDDQVPLGEGEYGSVFLGKFDGCQVAVKKVELRKVNDNDEKVLKLLDHPNVIKFLHSESDDKFK